jgi:hypothetical protein
MSGETKMVGGKLMLIPGEGGNAFPRPDTDANYGSTGMTMRDWYAGQVAAGYLAACAGHEIQFPSPKGVASYAFEVADAMIAEGKRLHEVTE